MHKPTATRTSLWWAGVFVLLPTFLPAADAQVEAAKACARQKDSLQRLVCYDGIFQAAESAPAARATEPVPAVAASPAPVAAAAPAPVAAAAVAAPVAAASTAPAAAAPALGDESVKKNRNERAEAPKSLDATVTAMREVRPNLYRVTLENGQIWQQEEVSSLFQVTTGDTIRIQKGSMGGYRMARISGTRSGWVRVSRVQ